MLVSWKTSLCLLQVTIITSGAVVADDSSVASLHHQQVALLATANGTHIAVQVGREVWEVPRAREKNQEGRKLSRDLEKKSIWFKKSSFQRTNPIL